VLLFGAAAACGDTGERISEEEAGVGTDAGMEVLVDTAATPAGGVPGMTPGGTNADTAGG
jgi:hypothetical protein